MKTLNTRLALSAAAIVALSATPAAAAGVEEAVVPPSNSAATQYTETFPTSGGDKKTDQKPQHSPSKVLGSDNAHKLREQGPEGQAAAEAAAATAPSTVEPMTTTTAPPAQGASGQSTKGSPDSVAHRGNGAAPAVGQAIKVGDPAPSPADLPAGSSGIGSAIEQATGLSTSGQSGMLLPLVILATVLCSITYLWRQRRQVD